MKSKEELSMKFRKINLEENVEYDAKVVSWGIDDDKRFVRIFVEIEGLDNIQFLKCIRYSEFAPSALSNFCEMFDIINKNGDVDFDKLIDVDIVVTMNQGRDGNFYVADIYPENYEENEDEQE